MRVESQWIKVLGVVRSGAFATVLLLPLMGAPQQGSAFYCEETFLTCSTVEACVEHINDDCGEIWALLIRM